MATIVCVLLFEVAAMLGDLNGLAEDKRRVLVGEIVLTAASTALQTFNVDAWADGGYYELEASIIQNAAAAGDLTVRFNGATSPYYRFYIDQGASTLVDGNAYMAYLGNAAGALSNIQARIFCPRNMGAIVVCHDGTGGRVSAVRWSNLSRITSIGFGQLSSGSRAGTVYRLYKLKPRDYQYKFVAGTYMAPP